LTRIGLYPLLDDGAAFDLLFEIGTPGQQLCRNHSYMFFFFRERTDRGGTITYLGG
jgi:hypothetical protein